ncbi:histidine phosphatase family protein [Aureimonas mangrovi]|uniref:histidine phosphatase family protein n=1 Tax=Aureimonas mangrovi TaxID=2758041 RepID=UPI001FE2A895|nr:histidine phosphatase family protein [Aureimonas mangrovi]
MPLAVPADPAALPRLFLCRHGQTDWNAEGRIQGQRDIPLNDHGRSQAARNGAFLRETLGEALDGWDFVASPMNRTQETMRILRREAGLPEDGFRTDERLMELNFGDWQGMTLAEIEARWPGIVAERDADKWNFRPSGDAAESYRMLVERCIPVFQGLKGPAIVVAHGGITRAFLNTYGSVDPADAAHARVFQNRVLRWEDGIAEWV